MTDEPSQPTQISFEHQKWLEDINRQDAHRAHDRWDTIVDSINEAAIKASETALRAAILINGGAAVSVLAFIGGLASKDLIQIERLSNVANSLLIFGFGVASATAGIGLSYGTHFLSGVVINTFDKGFSHPYVIVGPLTPKWTRLKSFVHGCAVISGLVSLGFFIHGMLSVRAAITDLGPPAITSGSPTHQAAQKSDPKTMRFEIIRDRQN